MSAPDAVADVAPEPLPEGLAEAGSYRTEAEGFDHGLVALAMGQPYWLVPGERGFRLLVAAPAVAAVRAQLACFDRESAGWPPRQISEATPLRAAEFATPLLWVLVVLATFWAQAKWPVLVDAGCLDVRALFTQREWWRPMTALFLHADLGHLVSNSVSGILVFSAVLSVLGHWRGWLLLATASFMGNAAVAAMYYPHDYRSLGASTAIFAGFGLLTGKAARTAGRHEGGRHFGRPALVRLAAGLTLLGLYGAGAGSGRVDVLAHLGGFLAGTVLGLLAKRSSVSTASERRSG